MLPEKEPRIKKEGFTEAEKSEREKRQCLSSQSPTTLQAFGGRRRAPIRGRCFQCRKTGYFVRNSPDLNVVTSSLLSVPECEITIICYWLVFIFTVLFIICAHFICSCGLLGESSSKGLSFITLSLDWVFRGCSLSCLISPALFIFFSRPTQRGSKPSTFVQKLFLVPCWLVGVTGGVRPKA